MEVFNFSLTTLGLICIFLNAHPNSAAASPGSENPVIYFTFPRWENRTFSPRTYYFLMRRNALINKLAELNKEYHKYVTDKGAVNDFRKSIPDHKIVFPPRRRLPSRAPTNPKSNWVESRSAIQSTLRKHNVLNFPKKVERNRMTGIDERLRLPLTFLLLPSTLGSRARDSLFPGRIAYDGTSSRRSVSIPSKNVVKENPTPKTFSVAPDRVDLKFTDDDAIDTTLLTFDIIKLSNWDDENVIVSPLSIVNTLALLYLGSKGKTYAELEVRLKPDQLLNPLDSTRERRYHTAFRRLLDYLHLGSNENVAINICNRVITDRRYPLLESFRHKAIEYYNAQSDMYDFQKEGLEVMQKVNDWVSYKTKGKISSILDDPPGPETTLMLLNAIYFRGDWESPFIKKITRKKPFHVSQTETMEVDMMTNILSVPYLETTYFRVIVLPYKGKGMGLYIMLPTNPGVEGLKEMERQLTVENLIKFNSMKITKVAIQLPKMKLESDGHIEDLLAKFGLESMFDAKTANFSRLSQTPGLHVSSVRHKSIFEMNEEGVTAAAVTVATGDRTLDERPVRFVVNRPFSFTVLSIKAKTILFFGRVTRPVPLDDS